MNMKSVAAEGWEGGRERWIRKERGALAVSCGFGTVEEREERIEEC